MHVTLLMPLFLIGAPADAPSARATPATQRRVAPGESWEIRDGRFFRNDEWVFLKTGKLLRAFENQGAADGIIADIGVLVDRLHFNHFSLNIYPDTFDADADGHIDADRRRACQNIGRILDACWVRGVFSSLSFETYNVGGGGTPRALFERHPDVVAVNALGRPAGDVEYFAGGKAIPSIFHPAYLKWSRGFIRRFLQELGPERTERLLYVETTVEPQYLGRSNYGDQDQRSAFLDFSEPARTAFETWRSGLAADDPARSLAWPADQQARDRLLGNRAFNRFRAEALAGWVNGDIEAIRSAAPDVYIAVDFNGRFDDPHHLRVGDPETFLASLSGVNVIQIAPHTPVPWGSTSWDMVLAVNKQHAKRWAVSEHMTATGDWAEADHEMTGILENTLARGTRWGWEFVKAGTGRERDSFNLYNADWTSPTLDVIEGANWETWLRKIGAPRFVPAPRAGRPERRGPGATSRR